MFLLLPAAAFGRSGQTSDVLAIIPESSVHEVLPGASTKFRLQVSLRENWHINSHEPKSDFLVPSRLSLVSGSGFFLEEIQYPEPALTNFAFSDVPVSVFEGTFTISGAIRAKKDVQPGMHRLALEFTFQGCRQETCSAPETVRTELPVRVRIPESHISGIAESGGRVQPNTGNSAGSGVSNFSEQMESAGVLLSLILVFFGGLALNLTPCVYPIIPVTISYFGAQSEGSTRRLFVLGLLYVVGMAVTYSVIGVVTSLTGAVFGGLLQQTPVILGIVAVFVVLSMGMFGLYEFKLPDSWVNRLGGSRSGLLGALFMGLTMGVIAAPCIGPFVLGLVAYVAAKGDPAYGFLLFFCLALGLGLPYLFLALFSGKIKYLPGSGQWMEGIRRIFGLVLLGMAVYFGAPLLPKNLSWSALPVFGIVAALYLLLWDRSGKGVTGFRAFKMVFCTIVLAVSGFALISGNPHASGDWQPFTPAAYEQAMAKEQKMVIVFHADWCIPCRELEAQTLTHPRVENALQAFRVFQVDMTHAMTPQVQRIRNMFDVHGVPTVVLINSQGNTADRLTGLFGVETFLDALSGVN